MEEFTPGIRPITAPKEKLQILTPDVCLDPTRIEAVVKVEDEENHNFSIVVMMHSGARIPLAYETAEQMEEQFIIIVNGLNEQNKAARFGEVTNND